MKKIILSCLLVGATYFMSSAQVTQDFESNDRTTIRNNCWIIWGYVPKDRDIISGSYSGRGQQLSNPSDSSTLVSPYTLFDGTGNITFKHRLSANNGSERVLYVALFDHKGKWVKNLLSYTYRTGNVDQTAGTSTTPRSESIPVDFNGVYRIGFYATGSGGNARSVIDDIVLPGNNAADASKTDGLGDCAALPPPPTVDQDFESGDRNAIRKDCWIMWGYVPKTNEKINGTYSARGQQLSNANDSSTLISPYTKFNGMGKITFKHRLSANNGTERVLYVARFDQNGDFVDVLKTIVYRTGNVDQTGGMSTTPKMVMIPVNFSGIYRIGFFANGSGGSSRSVLDDISLPGMNAADASNSDGLGDCAPLLPATKACIVSDGTWTRSTVITSTTANSYPWPGVSSLPDAATFTLPVVVGQPYPWVSIYAVDSAKVISSVGGVTYYRKTFQLSDPTDVEARFRMFVDDNMQIFINGKWIALEEDMGPVNFRTANHDIVFLSDGYVDNGHLGGDPFDYFTKMSLENIFVAGENEIILAVRNRTAKIDLGGFSFRMDVNKNFVVPRSAFASSISTDETLLNADVFPNPTAGRVNIVPVNVNSDQDFEVQVIDLNGKLVMSKNYGQHNSKEILAIDLSDLAKGVYSLRIENGNAFMMKKVVLQ